MATLEKIRSKSVFLFIIIIVALLAFILGDFLTSGRTYFGSGTTMMSAGKNKVDFQEYQAAQSLQQNQANQANQDGNDLEQAILKDLLMQQLFNEQYEQLGINITKNEITRLMTTENPYTYQFISQMAQALGLPAADGNTVLKAIKNPAQYGISPEYQGQLLQMWTDQEKQLEEQLKQQAVLALIGSLFTYNELDARSLYDDNMASTTVEFVSLPLAAATDEVAEPTTAELNEKYNELKSTFPVSKYSPSKMTEPLRAIDYVVVNIEPSQEDFAQALTEVEAAVAALNEQPALEGLNGRTSFMYEMVTLPVSKIKSNADLRTLPDSALVEGNVYQFPLSRTTNTYTIAKVQSLHQDVDSVKVSMYRASDAADADSILNMVKGNASFADINVDPQLKMVEQWSNPQSFPQAIKDLCLTNGVGAPFVYSDTTQGMYLVMQIDERKAPNKYADIAVIKRAVDPSNNTISDIKTQLNSFLASNSRGDLFSANADSLYRLQHGYVSAASPRIGNVKDTRKAVKWAMGAKPGQVSRIFDGQNAYVIVAVKDIYDGEYLPATAQVVQDKLVAEVTKDKKAKQLIDKYAGKANTIEEYAQAMGTEVRTDSTVNFNAQRVANFMPGEYALQGQLAAAAEGALVGPIQGVNEVIVYKVGPTTVNERPFNADQDGAQFMALFAPNLRNSQVLMDMLVGDRKVKNNSLNFVVDDQD